MAAANDGLTPESAWQAKSGMHRQVNNLPDSLQPIQRPLPYLLPYSLSPSHYCLFYLPSNLDAKELPTPATLQHRLLTSIS